MPYTYTYMYIGYKTAMSHGQSMWPMPEPVVPGIINPPNFSKWQVIMEHQWSIRKDFSFFAVARMEGIRSQISMIKIVCGFDTIFKYESKCHKYFSVSLVTIQLSVTCGEGSRFLCTHQNMFAMNIVCFLSRTVFVCFFFTRLLASLPPMTVYNKTKQTKHG